uniref:Ion transport domain-containing protein n=1 Tax=Mucochytrium quahogii TaxID=96639 RepID=A0A7S2RFV8_9STRA
MAGDWHAAASQTRGASPVDLIERRKTALRVGPIEFISLIVNRLHFSRAYALFYGFMIVINMIMLVWLVLDGGRPVSSIFWALEVTVTVVLALEISSKLIAGGCKYWSSLYNWFDTIVLTLCVFSLIHTHVFLYEEVDNLVSWVLLIARYILQALRLIALLRHRKNLRSIAEGDFLAVRRTSSLGVVDFNGVESDEEDENISITDVLDHVFNSDEGCELTPALGRIDEQVSRGTSDEE